MTAPFSAGKPLTKAYYATTSSNACLKKSNDKLRGHLLTSLFVKYTLNYNNDI
jgi:hypothetical protein